MKHPYNQTIETLSETIIIPEIVQRKADAVLHTIQSRENSLEAPPVNRSARKSSVKKAWAASAAVVLAMGTVTAGAATYTKWSQSLDKGLQATEVQKQALAENGASDIPNLSVTDRGVTVTLTQSIVDNYSAYIVFKIEGYELPENTSPCMAVNEWRANLKNTLCTMAFYHRIITDPETGNQIYDDGTPTDENAPFDRSAFIMDDGSLEYRISVHTSEKGSLLNKPFHVCLQGIGHYEDAMHPTYDIPGKWEFDWTLKGSSDSSKIALNQPLGDSGATVTGVEISPIGLEVTYDYKEHEETITYYSELEKKDVTITETATPPELIGVRTKDGKLLANLLLTKWSGVYYDTDKYCSNCQTSRIMDTDQIDALLFRKANPKGKYRYTAENAEETMYIVPIH